MAFISLKKHIDRRLMLKGSGAAVALPFLSAMLPAFQSKAAAQKPQQIKRFVAVKAPLGIHAPAFFPKESGRDYKLTEYLELIKEHRNDFTVFSGLSHENQNGQNGHSSDHTWLTGAQRPGMAGFKNTISVDQVMAAKVGAQTRYSYLPLTATHGSMSWTANGVNIPAIKYAKDLYKKLFIQSTEKQRKKELLDIDQSKTVLDAILQPTKDLEKTLGKADKSKLDEYLSSIRDLEVRLKQNESWVNLDKPSVEMKIDKEPEKLDIITKHRLYFDMIALAFQTDSTRVVTFDLGALGAPPKNIPGVKTDWHNLSHHGKDPVKIAELKLIESAVILELNRFLSKLRDTKEAGGRLLDSTAVLFGSNLGSAAAHTWRNLPLLVAGGGFKHGSHLAHDEQKNTAFGNLFIPLLHHMNVPLEKFANSTSSGIKGFS
ncbi:MAG: DUF1552 domain-containing protein [Lentisphaeraceae bacterium]|nr:DUF1552 domain-containing protein [Lentisphaeraceae bacterium]